uniref:BZIP domain-containing protein n=1 Tax=Hyaloperonospora arabidopsidis (strain Emoy2) TaxID=559515 RepID=M4BV97_HYAAE
MNDALKAESGDLAAVAAATRQSERKRLKHREYVKKSYKKKLTTLENLRRELDALDHQYASMLLQETGTRQHQQIRDENARAITSSQLPTMQKYLQATELKKWYREENDRLYQLNACHMKVESRMGQLLDAYEAAKVPLHCVPASCQYHISPLSAAAYEGLIDEAKTDVLCFARNPVKVSTGARILGWTDQREIHERKFEFALQKEIGVSPLVLLQRSWSIFSNPVEFSKIYGSALDVQFHVLQNIDEDTILFYRRIAPPADDSRVVKSIFLLAKRPIREGFLLLFRSIDKDLVHFREVDVDGQPQDYVDSTSALKLMRSEMWVDKDVWVLIRNVPKEPDKCLFQFGGATTTTLWLREVLFIAVRWENMAVGSQFSLTAD